MLYLLRHAESSPDPDTPEPDWPLSRRGKRQARALVDRLAGRRIEALYSSPYRRAVETVRPLARARALRIRTDNRLRERELTDRWLDDHLSAVRQVWADFDLVLSGGESSAQCQRRVVEAVRDLQARHDDDEPVLVSSHGNAISLYLNHLDSRFGFDEWRALRNPDLIAVQKNQWARIKLTTP